LYQALLRDSSFFDLLLRFDQDLAEETRRAGCACDGVLHRAFFERKPRGDPPGLGREHTVRFSYCCAVEGCRRRVTPPSLRFLGRKVFFGVVVLLVPVLRDGSTPARLERLRAEFSVSLRTLRRWIRWWRETFSASRFWLASRGRFARPVASQALPSSLCSAFEGLGQAPSRVLGLLRFLAPITTGQGFLGPAF
jgi:hypothetical protein